MITDFELSQLLTMTENENLDFKSIEYKLYKIEGEDLKSHDKEKAQNEILKDLIAFGNSSITKDSYIIMGVSEDKILKTNKLIGINKNWIIDDAPLQEYINSKTNKRIPFEYRRKKYNNLMISYIKIKKNNNIFYLEEKYSTNFTTTKPNTIYSRIGSSTASLSMEESFLLYEKNKKSNIDYEIEEEEFIENFLYQEIYSENSLNIDRVLEYIEKEVETEKKEEFILLAYNEESYFNERGKIKNFILEKIQNEGDDYKKINHEFFYLLSEILSFDEHINILDFNIKNAKLTNIKNFFIIEKNRILIKNEMKTSNNMIDFNEFNDELWSRFFFNEMQLSKNIYLNIAHLNCSNFDIDDEQVSYTNKRYKSIPCFLDCYLYYYELKNTETLFKFAATLNDDFKLSYYPMILLDTIYNQNNEESNITMYSNHMFAKILSETPNIPLSEKIFKEVINSSDFDVNVLKSFIKIKEIKQTEKLIVERIIEQSKNLFELFTRYAKSIYLRNHIFKSRIIDINDLKLNAKFIFKGKINNSGIHGFLTHIKTKKETIVFGFITDNNFVLFQDDIKNDKNFIYLDNNIQVLIKYIEKQ
jgi:hypothetical protein